MSVIELTTFTVKPENTTALLAARPGMVDAFRRDRRGFVGARLIRVADNTWLDLVEWTDDTAWDESKAKGANQPEIAAFFATIDTLVSSDRGVRYDDPRSRAVRTIAYGGLLAAWTAGRDNAKVPVVAAVSIAGVLDVVAADADKFGSVLSDPDAPAPAGAPTTMPRPDLVPTIAALAGDGIVPVLFGGHREDVPDRYARAVQPLAVPLLHVHGDADDTVPLAYGAHPTAEFHEVQGANHFDVIDPDHPTWAVIRDWLRPGSGR
jgi:pimeloyl-ACP methyl ester carboxylesterase